MIIDITCDFCGTPIQKHDYYLTKTNCCSRKCQNDLKRGTNITDSIKLKISDSMKKRFSDPEKRKLCNTWSGKKHSEKTKKQMSKSMRGLKHRPLTKLEKEFQRSLWTEERKLQQRSHMENIGLWRCLDDIPESDIYFKQSDWHDRIFDKLSSGQLGILHEIGIFNVYTNKNGIVRDHKYSRLNGYRNLVFPELIRHPFNCDLIRNYDNIKKRTKHKYDSVITLGDLFSGIMDWRNSWKEQELCIYLVSRYERGERWVLTPI